MSSYDTEHFFSELALWQLCDTSTLSDRIKPIRSISSGGLFSARFPFPPSTLVG